MGGKGFIDSELLFSDTVHQFLQVLTMTRKVRFVADILRNFASAAVETRTEKTCNSRHIATN